LAESSSQLLSANLQFFYFMVKSGRQNTRLFSTLLQLHAKVKYFLPFDSKLKEGSVFYPLAQTDTNCFFYFWKNRHPSMTTHAIQGKEYAFGHY
jgi:hypothetical protein